MTPELAAALAALGALLVAGSLAWTIAAPLPAATSGAKPVGWLDALGLALRACRFPYQSPSIASRGFP
jgi:hypothetical protein